MPFASTIHTDEQAKQTGTQTGVNVQNSQPISVYFLIFKNSINIISWFKIKANSYLNWFCCANNYQCIKNIVDYKLRYSLLKTLASKHNIPQNYIILLYTITPKVLNFYGRILISFLSFIIIKKLNFFYLFTDSNFYCYLKTVLFHKF